MVGSDFTEQGRLEVFLKGEWGYVTAGYYSPRDRHTVCRHLGYAGAFYTYGGEFARSSRPILIDISCGNNDMKITDCYILELSGTNSTQQERDEVLALCFPYGKYSLIIQCTTIVVFVLISLHILYILHFILLYLNVILLLKKLNVK